MDARRGAAKNAPSPTSRNSMAIMALTAAKRTESHIFFYFNILVLTMNGDPEIRGEGGQTDKVQNRAACTRADLILHVVHVMCTCALPRASSHPASNTA